MVAGLLGIGAHEKLAGEEVVPRKLGDDPNRNLILRFSACKTILNEEIARLEVCEQLPVETVELLGQERLVDAAPVDRAFRAGIAHHEFVPWRAAGPISRSHDESAA